MQKRIETYRGFEIGFNTESESFSAWNDFYDTEFSNKNYGAIKKGVDKYIKNNASFEPFEVVRLAKYGGSPCFFGETIKVTGIRKDGILTYKDTDGTTKRLEKYDAKSNFYLSFPELPEAIKIYNLLDKDRKEAISHFNKKVDELMNELPELTRACTRAEELMKNR